MDPFDDLPPADSAVPLPPDAPDPVFADPQAPDGASVQQPEEPHTCHNCDTALRGTFCHRCGQKDQDLDVRFFHLVSDWLGGVFGFDARLWVTLRLLLLRPGQLTIEFLEGRRVRYVPPLRLYLVMSLLMLLSLSLAGVQIVQTRDDGLDSGKGFRQTGGIITFSTGDDDDAPEEEENAAEAREDSPAATPELEAPATSTNSVPSTGQPPPDGRSDAVVSPSVDPSADSPSPDAADEPDPVDEEATDGTRSDSSDADGANEAADGDDDGFWIGFERKLDNIEEDRGGFDRAFRDYLPQALFLLVPVFALQLRVLFRRRQKRYLYHLIFSLHCHAAVFLLIAVTSPIDHLLGLDVIGLGDLASLAFFVYMFMALRRMFGDGRLKTGIKMVALITVHSLMLSFALLGAVVLAALKMQGG